MRGVSARRWFTLACATAGALALGACPPAAAPCEDDGDCAADQLCVDGQCVQVCNSAGECGSDEECRDGVCRPRRDSGAADALAPDSSAADRPGDEGGAADRWTPLDGPGRDQPGASDVSTTDLAAPVDASGLDTATADQGGALDAADPCAAVRCPEHTTCLALYDGSTLCLCGSRECVDGELCRPADTGSSGPRCCGPAQLNCGGVCRDVLDDELHCGGCDHRCAFGELCVQAQCACGGVGSCNAATQDCCNGACTDVTTDEAHCGPPGTGVGCSFACPGNLPCVDGLCQCANDGDCSSDQSCCNASYCANLATDLRNCRACGAVCRPGEICGLAGCACSTFCDDGDPCTEDRCVGGRCEHRVLDGDDDGYCAPGCSDPDGSDCVDGDCNDAAADVNPAEDEVCDGKDNDCNAATADGADVCPGLCCGAPRACQDCCTASQCGSGSWECKASACVCDGLDCGGHCYASGACCDDPNLCGGCTTLPYAPGTLCGVCGSYRCQGTDAVLCSGDVAVAGGWSDYVYTPWAATGTCGQYVACKQRETRTGTRSCTNPPPACGGAPCEGSTTITETRDTQACGAVDGGWTTPAYGNWTALGICGQFADCLQRETRSGTRSCTNPTPACGGADCTGSTTVTETQDVLPCGAVPGGWTDFSYSDWSAVGSCGQYQSCAQREERSGTRTCTNPAPACGGASCTGSATTDESQYVDCGDVDGGWSDYDDPAWTSVGVCGDDGVPCEITQQRTLTRTCTDPAPACEGAPCAGDATLPQTREVTCDDMSESAPSSGYVCCSGSPTDVTWDWSNCGSCGYACDQGPSYQCCNGYCTDSSWDSDNCGYCGNRCNYGPCCNGNCCEYTSCCGDYCC